MNDKKFSVIPGALDRTLRVWQNDEFFVRQGVFSKESRL